MLRAEAQRALGGAALQDRAGCGCGIERFATADTFDVARSDLILVAIVLRRETPRDQVARRTEAARSR